MRLTWFGTAALRLASGDAAIAFDPFLGLSPGRADNPFASVPDVFVTHGHFDHILQIPALCPDARVYATATPCRILRNDGMTAPRQIAPGQTVRVGPFAVHAFQSRHCRFDAGLLLRTAASGRVWKNAGQMLRLLRLNRRYPEGGETLLYEVCAEGKRIQILGSLGLDPRTDYPTGADALLLPYQGRSDLPGAAEAVCTRLVPKRVLLDHYDDSFPPMTTQIDTAPAERLLTRRGIPCRALPIAKTITL